MPSTGSMWGTATLMVTVVSCCSLVGVSIMPLISGPLYKSSITLFTGLAVGSLLGSAIFSLIPQAFGLHLLPDKAYLWKSLITFFGIYLFYCSERFMRIYFNNKERQKSQKESKSDNMLSSKNNISHPAKAAQDEGDVPNTSAIYRRTQDKSSESMTDVKLNEDGLETVRTGHHGHAHNALEPHEVITKALQGESHAILSRRAGEIAPLAWMIIIGDGLHNFIDGLSIGAAFTKSIYGGMSISMAVIFEELPHELGDFAVLIASGMTIKQALCYNFLSACTCYLGMIFGILLGDLAQSASYIFALAAGMFFYISLVDMMGELNSALEEMKDSTRGATHLLLMQNIGILSGITIIFLLSFLEPGS